MKDSFKELTLEELKNKKEILRGEYRKMRFDVVMGHVDSPIVKRTMRRKISRVNTLIHEFEIGIRKHVAKKNASQE